MKRFRLGPSDLHAHLAARMAQRGVSADEVEEVVNDGWPATDAKPGMEGCVKVFPYNGEWEGKLFAEKEVVVYFKRADDRIVVLTVKARYGSGFPRG